jgi:hypothetical protein
LPDEAFIVAMNELLEALVPPASAGDSLRALIDRLENYYDFECTGGPLRNCVEWQQLKAALVPPAEASAGDSLRALLIEACGMLKLLDRKGERQSVTEFLNRAEALIDPPAPREGLSREE